MAELIPDPCSLSPEGAIAQLGERLLCKQEVVGSIPSGSTRPRARKQRPTSKSSRSAGSIRRFLDIVKKGYARDAGHSSASSLGVGLRERCACTASRQAGAVGSSSLNRRL